MAELTQLIVQARSGDLEASARLFAAVYEELKRIAGRQVRQGQGGGLGDTSLVHEAYFRLARPEALGLDDRHHFYAVAAKVMRQIAIDHARERVALKRGGGAVVATLGAAEHVAADQRQLDLVLGVHSALEELESADERLARLVELRFYAGMSAEEAAAAMDISLATAKRDWRKARAFLLARLGDAAMIDDGDG
jgi:RNA polymerase sigma factor (TIGR02999 family)